MRKLAVVVACLLLVVALPLSAKSAFSGVYSIKGTNPGVGAYTGTLTISPRGEIYDVVWVIGAEKYGGIGVVNGETLSVAYAPADAPRYAVAVMLKGTNAEISSSTGGRLAGPVAKQVLDQAFAGEAGG